MEDSVILPNYLQGGGGGCRRPGRPYALRNKPDRQVKPECLVGGLDLSATIGPRDPLFGDMGSAGGGSVYVYETGRLAGQFP